MEGETFEYVRWISLPLIHVRRGLLELEAWTLAENAAMAQQVPVFRHLFLSVLNDLLPLLEVRLPNL